MSMLRTLKLSVLRTSRAVGVFRLLHGSKRRGQQLLILCYHGVSIDDEHDCAPGLYVSRDVFESRMEQLQRARSRVLPLDEAVRRLYDGTLPPRSVAITFDDGNFDFYSRAWPVLRAYGYPVTVYLTSYYCEKSFAVFPVALYYLLWKGRGAELSFPLSPDEKVPLDTRTPLGRHLARETLLAYARREGLSALEQDDLTRRLADELAVNYAEIGDRRILQLMTPAEVRQLADAGVDFQLHTHRHRSPLDEESYRDEVATNRDRISSWTDSVPTHFCYPSGVWKPQFAQWLAEEGVVSATTCEPGMATVDSNPYQLPRLLDHSELTPLEFDAWLAGLGALLPRRRVEVTPVDRTGRLIVEPAAAAMSASPT